MQLRCNIHLTRKSMSSEIKKKLSDCFPIPKSAPTLEKAPKSKSKKVFKMNDMWFFVTDTKHESIGYSIDLGVQIVNSNKKSKVMNYIAEHLDEIAEYIKEN